MNKTLSMAEAVDRYVPHGAAVAMGTALEALIPFAAGHEIIRSSLVHPFLGLAGLGQRISRR